MKVAVIMGSTSDLDIMSQATQAAPAPQASPASQPTQAPQARPAPRGHALYSQVMRSHDRMGTRHL